MSAPTLAPPRRPAGRPAPQPASPQPANGRAPRPHHAAERRVWRLALIGSVVFHVLVLVVSPAILRVGLPPGDPDARPERTVFRGIQMVDLDAPREERPALTAAAGQDADAAPTVFSPSERSDARPATADPARPAARPGEPVTPGAAPSGDRSNPLQPGIRDPRLWISPREVPKSEPTFDELHAEYMAGFERRLHGWNDSVAAEAERARRSTDWTVRDRNGGRWGVSPDGIHLGGVTLPPAEFAPGGGDPDKRGRAEQEARTRDEIDRQEADRERRRAQEEQIRATRERRDRERSSPP